VEITDYETMIAKLKEDLQSSQNSVTTLTRELETANSENKTFKAANTELQNKYTELEKNAGDEITRLSQELAESKTIAAKSVLSVTVKKVKYTTPTGRKYNIDGKQVSGEELVKNTSLCEELIEAGSHIFTKA
jgi:predicted transcriptional regulator